MRRHPKDSRSLFPARSLRLKSTGSVDYAKLLVGGTILVPMAANRVVVHTANDRNTEQKNFAAHTKRARVPHLTRGLFGRLSRLLHPHYNHEITLIARNIWYVKH